MRVCGLESAGMQNMLPSYDAEVFHIKQTLLWPKASHTEQKEHPN